MRLYVSDSVSGLYTYPRVVDRLLWPSISECCSLGVDIFVKKVSTNIDNIKIKYLFDQYSLSAPSTQYIVELAKNYGVSTDYLLGMKETATISVKGLSQKQVAALLNIIECFKNNDAQKNGA